ncbi:MAG: hypothetical protein ABIR46_04130, partial [Candidatus Saccharimonadales bacterium]
LVIANLGLVIAILIIVFSQATSVGLSNYGIKKLLPRVFAAAILMNLSFYICAVAVDLSNILGVSVKAIVEAGMNQLSEINNAGNSDVRYGAGFGQNVTVSLAGLMIAAVAIGTGAIWLLLPMLVTAVVAIITALLILAARQVLITLLIIISPLAILAWILPNTDEWFTKWRKLFTILLLLFPLIMAIFYGSILVSAVILSAGTSTGSGLNDFTIKLLAFMVLIVPLFSLPFIMKAAGGILDRFGVLVNNRNKGLIDRSRKKSTEMQDRTSYQRGKAIRKRTADEYRGTKFANKLGKGGRTGILARGVGGNLGRAKGLENTVFGEQSSRLGSYAVAAERKAASERRQSIAAGLRSEGVDMKELKGRYLTSVENGDVDSANAQLTHLATTFGAGGRQLAAEALDETRLSKITDVGKRAKMRTELNETIGGELYGSLITSRADIAKGGFRTQEDANGNTIAGSDNSFGFTDISKLTAPQIASQDKGVHEMGRVRGQAFDKSEAYIAATNGELISKITDTETRKEIARRSGVPLETSPANGQANSDPDANSQSGDPMETYVREQQAKNQQNNPNDTP